MHGRVKVRTTEEERERKKKEQALKVKAYRAAMTRIQAKRQAADFDDEMLQLTAQILLRNPDVATLWNIRRECVLHQSAALVAGAEVEAERLRSLYDVELGLTEQCLMVNPKSYGGWHHRCWTLEHSPAPDWQRELLLCQKYLKMDERNFHTWDYRRYVGGKADVPKQQELDFCTEKIKTNFSNYSSWHYRSLLLPALHPYEGAAQPPRPMSEAKLKEELEMVLTAAFTDPNDSSAWFYQRWLLGNSRPALDVCAFRCDPRRAVLAFTKPVDGAALKASLSGATGEPPLVLAEWRAANEGPVDTTWLCAMPPGAAPAALQELEIALPSLHEQRMPLKPCSDGCFYFAAPNRASAYTPDVLAELQTQLSSCDDLLEYEPESKWTLLTSALLMRAIDRREYHAKSLEYLAKLQCVDALRANYYKDLAAKWTMEKVLGDWADSPDIPARLEVADGASLSALYYGQYWSIADSVSFAENPQRSLDAAQKTFGQMRL